MFDANTAIPIIFILFIITVMIYHAWKSGYEAGRKQGRIDNELFSHDSQLTTQQAAIFLGIPQSDFTKLLDNCEIPYGILQSHRTVTIEDLLIYSNG